MADALANVLRLPTSLELSQNKRYSSSDVKDLYTDILTAGENISIGDILFISSANTVSKAISNAAGLATHKYLGMGIALETKLSGSDILVFTVTGKTALYGPGGLTAGTPYYISDTVAGEVISDPDTLALGSLVYRIGIAEASNLLKLLPNEGIVR